MPSNALPVLPLPLQQRVVDVRDLLTVPWTMLFRQMLAGMAIPTYAQGTHEERVGDPTDQDPPGMPATGFRSGAFFYETDRNVLYQARLVGDQLEWVYVAGEMTGTLTPDERPDDLDVNDTGFIFEATDTGQTFLWDGTAWVDITPYPYATYGTHAERLAHSADTLEDGALWCETDRSNVLYQIQGGLWWFIAGTMYGTLSPDQRPVDLGVRDAGFEFRTSEPPQQHFIWSQVDWQEVTPGAPVQDPPQPLALQNSWVNFGGGYAPGAYLRDSNGWVHLRGMIANGAVTAGTILATLPAGYRPVAVELFTGIASGVVCVIQVDAFGNVGIPVAVASNLYISLSGISFATHG